MNWTKLQRRWQRQTASSACIDATIWLETQPDIETAWQTCQHGDWMLWVLHYARIDSLLDLRLQMQMLATPLGDGRTVEDLLTDSRSIEFVAMKRQRIAGEEIAFHDWRKAAIAAWDARYNNQSRFDVDAADAAASEAAWDVCENAIWTVRNYLDTSDPNDLISTHRWQADAVRELVPEISTLLNRVLVEDDEDDDL